MEKRVFLAIFLSFAVLAVYQTYFVPKPPPGTNPAAASSASSPAATPAPSAPGAAAGTPTTAPAAAAPVQADPTARDIVVETDTVRAVFNTQGAVLKSWRLLHYSDRSGEPLELIPGDLPPGAFMRPFTMSTDDAAISATLASAVYQVSAERLSLGSATGTLTFEYRGESGLAARKTFYFQPDGLAYVLNLEASVERSGTPLPLTMNFGPAIGLGYEPGAARPVPERAIHYLDNSAVRLVAGKLQTQPKYEGTIKFAGVEEHYFLAAALPSADRSAVEYAPVTLPVPGATEGQTRSFISFSVRSAAGGTPTRAVTTKFFLGPKDFDLLRAVDPTLVCAIDFGMFRAIVVPLLQALKWINGYIGNYGWSIVALTVIINILIFPLRHRSMVSMKKMQSLQPELKAIQDRYAKYKVTDPERQKMNSEMMALYKQKGVNPAVVAADVVDHPMLLGVLCDALAWRSSSVARRSFGWIHDLARRRTPV